MIRRPDLLALSADLLAHLARVDREVGDIEGLVGSSAPDRTVLWAVAGHLQAYYTGCEVIIQRALERFEGLPPHGAASHVRLLEAAVLEVPGVRPALLRHETAGSLNAYRAFRHFFRHGYGVDLEWPRMEDKVRGIRGVHREFTRDVDSFREFLDAATSA